MIGPRIGLRVGPRVGLAVGVGADQIGAGAISYPSWTLTKTVAAGWGNAGASSVQTIAGDGWVECTGAGSGTRILGLSLTDPDQGYSTVIYGFMIHDNGTLYWIESGSFTSVSTYVAADVMRVRRTGTTITYEKNGAVLYTSLIASTGSLLADTAFDTAAGELQSIKLYPSGIQAPITWQNVVGCTATEVP